MLYIVLRNVGCHDGKILRLYAFFSYFDAQSVQMLVVDRGSVKGYGSCQLINLAWMGSAPPSIK